MKALHKWLPSWWWLCLAGVLLALAFGVIGLNGARLAQANVDPPGCNTNGLNSFLSVSPAGAVFHGDALTYTVTYSNSNPPVGTACNISELTSKLFKPDASSIEFLTSALLPVGAIITCPGGAGCLAGPYTYIVNHANETQPPLACPAVPLVVPGSVVTAYVQIQGGGAVLHKLRGEDSANDCKSISTAVIHTPTVTTAIQIGRAHV